MRSERETGGLRSRGNGGGRWEDWETGRGGERQIRGWTDKKKGNQRLKG